MKELERAFRWVAVATGLLYLVVAALLVYVYVDSARTTTALCTLRDDLSQRVASSEQFLKDHPHGIPGIPAAVIRQGITNQQRTIDALSSLRC